MDKKLKKEMEDELKNLPKLNEPAIGETSDILEGVLDEDVDEEDDVKQEED